MNPEEPVAKVNNRAKYILKSGFNCAECVQEILLLQVSNGLSDDCMRLMTGCAGGGTIWGDNWGSQLFPKNAEGLT